MILWHLIIQSLQHCLFVNMKNVATYGRPAIRAESNPSSWWNVPEFTAAWARSEMLHSARLLVNDFFSFLVGLQTGNTSRQYTEYSKEERKAKSSCSEITFLRIKLAFLACKLVQMVIL